MNRSALVLIILPLVACGTETSVDTANDNVQIGQSADGLAKTSLALSESRTLDLIASYRDIANDAFDSNQAVAFPDDIAVAVVDVTAAIRSARFSGMRELWVPAGTVAAPRDPNMSRQFYVATHTSAATTIYGPFTVYGREGADCGSSFAGALPTCAASLSCQSAGNPDQPGTCVAN